MYGAVRRGYMPVDGLRDDYMPVVDGLRSYMQVDGAGFIQVEGAIYMYRSRVTHRNNDMRPKAEKRLT